jgi:hypothetical protein
MRIVIYIVMNFTMIDSDQNFRLHPGPNPFILFSPIILVGGRILYDTYKVQLYTLAQKVYSKFIGLERFNRAETQIFRELHNYEYGQRYSSGFHTETEQVGIFKGDKLNGPGHQIIDTRLFNIYSKGIFRDNKLNGIGTYVMTNKDYDYVVYYEGDFVKNALHGEGTVRCKYFTLKGTFEHGQFINGSIDIHEFNRYVMDAKYKIHKSISGNFGKNAEHMYCTTILPFFDLNGHGNVVYYNTGVNESGSFLDGDLHGYGMREYPEYIEEGMFRGGCLHGSGKHISETFTVSAEFEDGDIMSKYDVLLDNDVKMHNNLLTNTFDITFQNGDTFTFTPLFTLEFEYGTRNRTHDFKYLLEELFSDFMSDATYTVNESLETLDKKQFMYWLYATDKELFDIVSDSNLDNFIDGKLFMSFEKPSDFDLPDINDNVLQKLLEYKNTVEPNPDGIVLVTKIV